MQSISIVEFGLTKEQFLDLSPAEFFALCKAKKSEDRKADLRAGLVAATILNLFRGKNDAPFQPLDFFSQHQDEEYESREERQDRARNIMRQGMLLIKEKAE